MNVTFYCYLSSPGDGIGRAQDNLNEFLSEIKDYLQPLLDKLGVLSALYPDSLAPEPNFLKSDFDHEGHLVISLQFQYLRLEHAHLRLDLLKSLFLNLVYGQYIDCWFEYHLEE